MQDCCLRPSYVITNVEDGVLPVQDAGHHVEDGEADGGDDGDPGLSLGAPDLG